MLNITTNVIISSGWADRSLLSVWAGLTFRPSDTQPSFCWGSDWSHHRHHQP